MQAVIVSIAVDMNNLYTFLMHNKIRILIGFTSGKS